MNFLVDAQLPRRLARRLQEAGHDVLHTLDLPAGNSTTDSEINALSLRKSRVVSPKTRISSTPFFSLASPISSSSYPPAISRTRISKPCLYRTSRLLLRHCK